MGPVRDAIQRRVIQPVKQQLWQGVTPRKLALSLALGVVVSVMPLLGITTVVALAVSLAFRLNHVAIVAANYAAYPLQIVLFIPFFQAGAWITRGPPVPFSLEQIRAELAAGVWPTLVRYADANARALLAWAVVAPLASWVLYLVFHRMLSRLPFPRQEPPPAP
jgi:uncharacterized protein (DUF2062 family)